MDRATFGVKDASFKKTTALSNGAGTVNAVAIDIGLMTGRGAKLEGMELLITAPALTTTQLPNSETMTYKVQEDTMLACSSPETLGDAVLVQTGAGGAGAAAATARFRLPSDCQQFIRVTATKTGTGDASTVNMVTELLF